MQHICFFYVSTQIINLVLHGEAFESAIGKSKVLQQSFYVAHNGTWRSLVSKWFALETNFLMSL
jgi:hypothetical protein